MQANLAVAASPGSGAAAGDPDWAENDSRDDLEIGRSASHLRLLIAAGFAMTLLSASVAFGWWSGADDLEKSAAYVGVVLFGLASCRLVWMLPSERGPVVIITSFGIRDLRIGNEFLLWDSIAEVSAGKCRGRDAIVLKLTPALQKQRCSIKTGDAARRGDLAANADHVVVSADGLATSFDALLQACRACHAASEQRAALQQA